MLFWTLGIAVLVVDVVRVVVASLSVFLCVLVVGCSGFLVVVNVHGSVLALLPLSLLWLWLLFVLLL